MKSPLQGCGAGVQGSSRNGWFTLPARMRQMASIAITLLCFIPASIGQEPPLRANTNPIPELATSDGQRFSQVVITKHAGGRIAFEHEMGLETRRLAEFDETNLDRIFPGLLARKAAATAEKQRIEKARQEVIAEASSRYPLERTALETRLKDAITEALRPVDAQTMSDNPLVCVLVSGKDQYELGEEPFLAVRIVNRSTKEVLLMTELPSCGRPSFPKIDLKVTDPNGKPFTGFGSYCGTMGELHTRQFVSVPPGGVVDPKSTDLTIFHLRANRLLSPGTYKIAFEYSTSSRMIGDYIPLTRDWFPSGGDDVPPNLDPAIQRLLKSIDHVDVRSKTLALSFRVRGH